MAIDIRRLRLAGQFLTTAGPLHAAEVVRALGAVQSQDYAGAKWGLAQRSRGRTDAEIEREIDDGEILRTHVLRPTWHFVARADIRWMLALTGPRVSAMMAPANRRLELDGAVFRRSHAVLAKALGRGHCLTRAELKAHLERAGVKTVTGQRLGHMMMQAELDGVVCSGPRRGKQFTYGLLDERAPPAPSLTRDEALRELTCRYFTTRGPATPRDFAWWSGLTVADAKRGIVASGDALRRVSLGTVEYWLSAEAAPPPRPTRTAHLLPNYDEYFIGYRDRSAIGNRARDTSTVTGGNALIPHVIIVDGELVGIWKRTLEKDTVVVRLHPLVPLSGAESARVAKAARDFGSFLELPVEVRLA
jgi:hypothetical protein